MMNKITLEEKIEVIRAFSEGKPVEGYNKEVGLWEDKVYDIWDFDNNLYRIRYEQTFKFKVNDNLVYRRDDNNPSPTIYTVMNIDNNGYTLNGGEFEKSPSVIEKEYISERDVLWYFEWKTTNGQYTRDIADGYRLTIDEANEIVKNTNSLIECYPIRVLGFRLKKEDTNDLKRED